MDDLFPSKKEVQDTEAYQETCKAMGKEFTDEYVDFTLGTVQKYLSQPMEYLSKQINSDLFPQFAKAIPLVLLHATGMIHAFTMVETNMFMWGAFFYRRWLVQGGVDVEEIEKKAVKGGKVTM